ncbi:unnamed protein product [Adineta steineri]|uniref:Uncharacterized protein n=1 Tax=Adineta steineri TaxID=433720 RepID=A0A815LTI3_9BILA|nr:unnamed protein product [Adineta steineri]CAF3997426.1 unnamed protein product [Adineta steineri]
MRLWVIIVFTLLILIELMNGQKNAYEYEWIHSMGNPSNSRRMVPSIPTNFTGKSWRIIFNNSSQAKAIQGTGAGSNGDLYFFISNNSSHSADYIVCLTLNGSIRWKIYLQPINEMINVGVSNIISIKNGLIYFISCWTNGISSFGKVSSSYFHVIWQWNEPYGSSAQSTQPIVSDQSSITYISILPYIYAIDSHGSTLWKTQIVSQDETKRFNLVSNCLSLNTETNIIYILVSSSSNNQLKYMSNIFIVPVRINNGQLLDRINIDIPSNAQINAHCPVLIGNEAIYLSWIMGNDPDLVSLNIMAVPQI